MISSSAGFVCSPTLFSSKRITVPAQVSEFVNGIQVFQYGMRFAAAIGPRIPNDTQTLRVVRVPSDHRCRPLLQQPLAGFYRSFGRRFRRRMYARKHELSGDTPKPGFADLNSLPGP